MTDYNTQLDILQAELDAWIEQRAIEAHQQLSESIMKRKIHLYAMMLGMNLLSIGAYYFWLRHLKESEK